MSAATAPASATHGHPGAPHWSLALAAPSPPPVSDAPPALPTTAVLLAIAVVVLAHRFRPHPTRIGGGPVGRGVLLDRVQRATATIRLRHTMRAGITPGPVADWCDRLARTIRAGETLRAALVEVEPADPAVRVATDPVRTLLERGRPVAEATAGRALGLAPGRRRHAAPPDGGDHLDLALSVISTCGRLGGSAAAPLDRVAAALRQRAADDQERSAQSAQARLSAHVLTLVPLGVLGLLVTADPAVRAALTTPAGLLCVTGGVTLNVLGWAWMRHLVRDAGR